MEQEARDAERATDVRALRGGRRGNAYSCRLHVHVRLRGPVWELLTDVAMNSVGASVTSHRLVSSAT